MRFITEMELRDLYKIEPFTAYALKPGTKITPGARQFLVDRRVTLVQDPCTKSKNAKVDQQGPTRDNWCILRLRRKMDYLESLFLLVAAEFLHSGATVLSAEIQALGKCFRNIKDAEREQITLDNIEFWGWTEEEIKKRSSDLEMEISDFHLGLENGKELAWLNHLRASLRELEPAILESYWSEEKQVCLRQDLIDKLYLNMNILCMMMWKCLGGQKWKR